MDLNPLYEITYDLGLCDGTADLWQFDSCYRERIARLAVRRPEFQPFLDLALANAPADQPLTYYFLRARFSKLFAYAIPTPMAIQRIAALGSICEIGAGTGYWSALLQGAGASVSAYDNGSWKIRPLYFDVRRGGANKAAESDAQALLLCWPPYKTPMALRALRAFRGPWIVYVGEPYGCTASERFHAELERDWDHADTAPSVQWPGLHDRVELWRRRKG